jgi:ubiquinone/menaquinone biosynthesis C-methylase UbiE
VTIQDRTATIQDRITTFWNAVAPHYECHPGNTSQPGTPEYEQWVALYQRVLPASPGHVLDVGTGTGFSALMAANLGHRVTAIDLAAEMLAVARQRARQKGLDVSFAVGDAVAPPYAGGTFDVVTARHCLWTLRAAEDALRNWHRLLRSGGQLIVIDAFHAWSSSDPESGVEQFFRAHYTEEVQAAATFMHVKDHTPLVSAFDRAGFRQIAFERLDESFGDAEHDPYMIIASR